MPRNETKERCVWLPAVLLDRADLAAKKINLYAKEYVAEALSEKLARDGMGVKKNGK